MSRQNRLCWHQQQLTNQLFLAPLETSLFLMGSLPILTLKSRIEKHHTQKHKKLHKNTKNYTKMSVFFRKFRLFSTKIHLFSRFFPILNLAGTPAQQSTVQPPRRLSGVESNAQVSRNKNHIFQKFLSPYCTNTYVFLNCKKFIFFTSNAHVPPIIGGVFF